MGTSKVTMVDIYNVRFNVVFSDRYLQVSEKVHTEVVDIRTDIMYLSKPYTAAFLRVIT